MKIVVTGGAGYIGATMAHMLCSSGHEVIVVDNLSTGVKANVPDGATFLDLEIEKIHESNLKEVDQVFHFAAATVVPESVENPEKYYSNNVVGFKSVLDWFVDARRDVKSSFIFSSTAAVYGDTDSSRVTEKTSTSPTSPYGASKLVNEWMLRDYVAAYDLAGAALRYFNVAGADPLFRCGQSTPNATHLIKRCAQVAVGRRDGPMTIYGTDYPTHDGTGVRDYIHVTDLCAAHIVVAETLRGSAKNEFEIFNCGYGRGYSVQDVIETVRALTGSDFEVEFCERRPGDIAEIAADSSKLKSLGWVPEYQDLSEIVRTALEWERRL